MITRMFQTDDSDDGVTLIELVMYVLLSVIVVGLSSAVFLNSINTQQAVVSETTATNQGQLVAGAIERSVRNALAFTISSDGSTLEVRTSLKNYLVCQGFSLSTTTGAQFIQTTSTIPDPSTWPLWQTGIVNHGTTPFFQPSTTSPNGIDYSFDVIDTANGARLVHIAGTVTPRNPTGDGSACWSTPLP